MADRKADKFAGEGSVAAKLKKRRELMESGDAAGLHKAWDDLSVDNVKENKKTTTREEEIKKETKKPKS